MVVCGDVPKGEPVLLAVLETERVEGRYVVCGVWGLLDVPEEV